MDLCSNFCPQKNRLQVSVTFFLRIDNANDAIDIIEYHASHKRQIIWLPHSHENRGDL